MERILLEILNKIQDPALIVSTVGNISLFYLLILKERANREMSVSLSGCEQILNGLVKLVEVIVYGKKGENS